MRIKDENIESIAHSICDFRDKLEDTYHEMGSYLPYGIRPGRTRTSDQWIMRTLVDY